MDGRRMLCMLVAVTMLAATALAGEPDWFTRVKNDGLEKASRVEVERYEKGVLEDSLHVGECYYHLGRYAEGIAVFQKLLRSLDRNYAAAALVRIGEGQFHLGNRDEARKTFTACLAKYPEAYLDGSIPELCRAWLGKLDGKLKSQEALAEGAAKEGPTIDELKQEMKELNDRLDELKALIRKLADEE